MLFSLKGRKTCTVWYVFYMSQESEVVNFINELAKEVQKRLQALETRGRCITLKVGGMDPCVLP